MWGNKVYSKEDACYESMLNAYIESDGLQVKICAACGKKVYTIWKKQVEDKVLSSGSLC